MTTKKLQLKKETLRSMNETETHEVNGGMPLSWGSACVNCFTDACLSNRIWCKQM